MPPVLSQKKLALTPGIRDRIGKLVIKQALDEVQSGVGTNAPLPHLPIWVTGSPAVSLPVGGAAPAPEAPAAAEEAAPEEPAEDQGTIRMLPIEETAPTEATAPADAPVVEEPPVPVLSEDKLPVCIIGAGCAGLYAAMMLKDLGIPFVILEANPGRCGGRLYTHRFTPEAKTAPVNDPKRYDYIDMGVRTSSFFLLC